MRIKFFLAALLISGVAAAQQVSSPFGIPVNSTKQKLISLGGVYQEKYKTWRITTPPTPNTAFEDYTVIYTDKFGICQIRGIGKTITTTQYGDGVKSQFSALRSAVASKYGQDKNYDFLHAGSIWDEDKYWMRSLEQYERSLISFWNVGSGAKLPLDLKEIVLSSYALSSTEGYVNLAYRMKNYDACIAEWEKANTNGL